MIEIYADGADFDGIMKAATNPEITGFTTNPTLMKAAGITDYEKFAKNVIFNLSERRPGTNLSLEVFADENGAMYDQARKIASWGEEANYDVFVKIPVTNTKKLPNYELINILNQENIKVNVTAVFTANQTYNILESVTNSDCPLIISIFAGRIADTLRDPSLYTMMCIAQKDYFKKETVKNVKFLWASCRELYHLKMAQEAKCDIITMLHDQINKLSLEGKDLEEFSVETVKMFYNDAVASGYRIEV